MRAFRRLAGGVAAVIAVLAAPASTFAAVRPANPGNFASVVAGVSGGDIVDLSAGSYGRFGGVSKPSMVTLRAAPGVTASIDADLDGARNLRFENLRVTSANLVRSTSIQFLRNVFTGSALIDTTDLNGDHAILFDGNVHDGITVCSSCYEGRVTVHGSSINTKPVGVTIRNSRFADGGNSDGIQVGSYGVQIINNEFADLPQGDPDLAHTDAIQLYGQSHTVILNNYMRNVATGILCGDGCDHERIENNVISTISSYPAVLLGPDRDSIIRHNTFPSAPVRVDRGNGPGASIGTVIQDNIIDSYILEGSSLTTNFNLVTDGSSRGGSDIRDQPQFVGGDSPSSVAGYRLAAGSPGKGTASDGKDRGADISAIQNGLPGSSTLSPSGVQVTVRKRISWDRLRKGVRVRVRSPRDIRLRLTMIPRGRKSALARRTTAFAAGNRNVIIRPSRRKLGGRRNRSLRLVVKIIEADGTFSFKRFSIRVRA